MRNDGDRPNRRAGIGRCSRRRGVILPVLLMILLLLGVLGASFAFRVHADRSALNAVEYRLHTRLAAEAGIQKVLLMLRTQRDQVSSWYNNPDELNRIIVWTPGDETLWGSNEELEDPGLTYRFSIVADNPFDDEDRCRYGITDESAKLNINTATREQLVRLISQIATPEMVVEELADALLDWVDQDDTPRLFGAESAYYGSLDTPYKPKNAAFDTVEELLMVKGFDGRVLYGEDYDRNGLLTPNEKDGLESFPEDDGDEVLNRGLYPYITVVSRDTNTDPENRPRIYLYGDPEQVRERLSEFIEPAKVDFIVGVVTGQVGGEEEEEETNEGQEEVNERPEGEQENGNDNSDGDEGQESGGGERRAAGRGGETESPTSQPARLNSPADLMSADAGGVNPLTLEDLEILMARTTTVEPLLGLPGMININTAPPQVLRCLPGLTDEQISAIAAVRAELTEEEQANTAWLVTREVLDVEAYAQVAPLISARGLQFTIESVGHADHIGTMTRLQVIVEMRGPVAQVIYERDLTTLGTVYPIREGEEEFGFGGQAG